MILRAFRLWYARFKLGLVRHEISATIVDAQDAAFDGDCTLVAAFRTYLYQLKDERILLEDRIKELERKS